MELTEGVNNGGREGGEGHAVSENKSNRHEQGGIRFIEPLIEDAVLDDSAGLVR